MPRCDNLDALINVEREARLLGVRVAYTLAWLEGKPGEIPQTLVESVVREARSRYRVEDLPGVPEIRAYRDFYWRIGVDPTKTRPSSEALLRRALRGVFPRINTLVDAGNIASLETLIPIGIYDLEKASPPLRLTISRGGERFLPIGGGEETLPPGLPILLDSSGVVMHLYPHRDSRLTAVTNETSLALIVGGGVPGIADEKVAYAARRVADILSQAGWNNCGRVVLK